MNYRALITKAQDGDFDTREMLDPRDVAALKMQLKEYKSKILPASVPQQVREERDAAIAALQWILERPSLDRLNFAMREWSPDCGVPWEEHVKFFDKE